MVEVEEFINNNSGYNARSEGQTHSNALQAKLSREDCIRILQILDARPKNDFTEPRDQNLRKVMRRIIATS